MTILEAIQLSSDFLKKKDIVSPRLNAELLLADIVNVKRFDLYLRFDKPLTETEINKYRDYIVRRSKNEPLQYILGHQEFYGLSFVVSPAVLVPRSDTEVLVEESIKLIKATDKDLNILEVGAGSGNICIAVSNHCSNAKITAIDVSSSAIEIAKINAKNNSVAERINFVNADIESFNPGTAIYDFIISNPPYISKSEMTKLQIEVKDHEPRIALTDESDGLTYYRIISEKAKELLKSKGKIIFEIGMNQADDVKNILSNKGFNNILSVKDYSEIERVVIGELM